MSLFTVTLALCLAQAPTEAPSIDAPQPPAFLRDAELLGGTGVFFSGAVNNTVYDFFLTPGVEGAFHLPESTGGWAHLRFEGALHGALPVGTNAAAGLVAQLRAGVTFPTWQATLGAWTNVCFRCSPATAHANDGPRSLAQLMPSATFRWQPAFWGVSGGAFDEPMGVLGHLDLRAGAWTIGYSFPVGALVAFQPRLSKTLGLDLRALGFSISGGLQVGLSVGLAWLPG